MPATTYRAFRTEAPHQFLQLYFHSRRLGRITEEVQILYDTPVGQPGKPPAIEHQHRIAHQLDQLGNRQQSQLQNTGSIDWLLYGAGHLHGISHNWYSTCARRSRQ